MKKYLTFIVAVIFVSVAYVWSFGMPSTLTSLMPGSSVAQSSNAEVPGRVSRQGRGATAVVTDTLRRQPHADILRAIGSTFAQNSVDVVAGVEGMVVEASIHANADITEGDVLVKLDSQTESFNLEIAQAELDQAQQTVDRYQTLSSSSGAFSAVEVAEAAIALRLAEANLGLARVSLSERTVRAPIAGKLGLSDIEVGDQISSDQVLVTIDDTETMQIEFELPERSVGLLEIGRTILANTPVLIGRTFEGKVIAFDSRIDDVTRSVTVRAQIENPGRILWTGMTFAIRLIDESEPLPVVPATAITWTRDGSGVWVDTDGVASRILVTILYREGDQVWVDGEIPDGASIVTEGAHKLREGAALSVEGNNSDDPA